jgi:hypothetical protein
MTDPQPDAATAVPALDVEAPRAVRRSRPKDAVFDYAMRVRADLEFVHKPNGTGRSFARCVLGTGALLARRPSDRDVDLHLVSCSVLPRLTTVWAHVASRSLTATPHRIWVADCSGGIKVRDLPASARCIPVLNLTHGRKLDLLLAHVTGGSTVVISDDDVLITSRDPIDWAVRELAEPQTAVVSFMRRHRFQLQRGVELHAPMGSYSLVVDRTIWRENDLSFRPRPAADAPEWNPVLYDTGDIANIELLRRGYEVVGAPDDVAAGLVRASNISSSVLRLRKGRADETRDLYLAGRLGQGIDAVYERLLPKGTAAPVLDAAVSAHYVDEVVPLFSAERRAELDELAESMLAPIRARLGQE